MRFSLHVLSCVGSGVATGCPRSDSRRDSGLDIGLTTYTHDSELQAITAPPLISTIHQSPQHPLSRFPACCVFISRSLAAASASGDSSASRALVLSSQTPVQNWLGRPNCLPCNPVSNSVSVAARQFVAVGTSLPSRYLETGLIYLPLLRSSHNNGSTHYNI
jgi:hypothetical protein